jgi:type IV secretory pathway VirB10-like protein
MQPGSFLLELLPWIPPFMLLGRGYFRITSGPTPIGNMFTNTPINHVGLALERSSCPQLCPETMMVHDNNNNNNNNENTTSDIACLWQKGQKEETMEELSWAHRNFVVEPVIITEFVERFLLHRQKEKEKDVDNNAAAPSNSTMTITSCQDFQKQATRKPRIVLSGLEQDFTLFNVLCHDDADHDDKKNQETPPPPPPAHGVDVLTTHQYYSNYTGTQQEIDEAEKLRNHLREMEESSSSSSTQ